MPDIGAPQLAAELGDQFVIAFEIFVARDRDQEVARVGQAVRADRAEVRQAQQGAEVLAHIAARRPVRQIDGEAHAARDHGDLLGFELDQAEFGGDREPALLGHDQQLAVGGIEIAAAHRLVGCVQVDRAAGHRGGRAVAGHGDHAVDEIGGDGVGRDRQRAPAHLVGRGRAAFEVGAHAGVRYAGEIPMHGGRTDAVQPGTPVVAARRREGRSRQLLGVESIGHPLRRIAVRGQGAGQGFGREFVAEAGHVGGAGGVVRYAQSGLLLNVVPAQAGIQGTLPTLETQYGPRPSPGRR
jgi:hypothetical protein